MRKLLGTAILGAAIILAWVFFIPHTGITYKLEATPELTKIVSVPDAALPQMETAISEFAKANNLQLSMRGGFSNKYQLIAQLTSQDVNITVRNPITVNEVYLAAYHVPNSQITKVEIEVLLTQLECKVLATCK